MFAGFYRPKYGHFEMIFPNDVQVVRKGDAKLAKCTLFRLIITYELLRKVPRPRAIGRY